MFGVASISITPLRKEAAEQSEQVSQLLFGETYAVIKQVKKWLLIQLTHDKYTGWISSSQHTAISKKEYDQHLNSPTHYAFDLSASADNGQQALPITVGSMLPYFDGMQCKLANNTKWKYHGLALEASNLLSPDRLVKIVNRYLNAPYLWGGRTPFGIDCSGFTQMVFRFFDTLLPRDASEQSQLGRNIDLIESTQVGDLAFFKNENEQITHVGILIAPQQIVHASGKVRIDFIDNHGILNEEINQYSHRLAFCKRIL